MKTAQLGIELGTRHLRICTRDKEEFLKIKNMIAFDEDAKLKAFGNEAFAMYEKQPYSIHVVKPMEHGVISDYTNMRYLLGTVLDLSLIHILYVKISSSDPNCDLSTIQTSFSLPNQVS